MSVDMLNEIWRAEPVPGFDGCLLLIRQGDVTHSTALPSVAHALLAAQAPAMARLLRDLAADIRRVGLESTDPARRGALEIAGQIDDVLLAAGVGP